VVGTNVIEAMILAALGKPPEEVSDDDFIEILDELAIKPRLLHPTGSFRNIRRFAFVIHPLSQEFIRKGFPIPKGTPKFVMDQVETWPRTCRRWSTARWRTSSRRPAPRPRAG
jgi:hypothetical protein